MRLSNLLLVMNKIDIIKLAEVLNLSTSTISRAFRDNGGIRPETRERILRKAKEMNYRPNHYASLMRVQKSRTIAVVVPELGNDYFTRVVQGVEKTARTKGYHTLIYATDDDMDKERAFIESLSDGRADGVVMSVSGEAKDHSYLEHINPDRLPIVLFDRVYDDVDLPKITTDDYRSSFVATEHLIQNGCARIACLVVNRERSIGKARVQGYMDALKKHRIRIRKRLIVDCTNPYAENEAIIENALKKHRPDGIFATVERLAFSTYYVCQRLRIAIPEDVKVIAFSGLEIASLLAPALTTIRQPALRVGEKAAEILLKLLDGEHLEEQERSVTMESELIVRQSSSMGATE